MTAYIIRRLLCTIPIVFGVLLLTFCLFSVAGGDISIEIAGKGADAEISLYLLELKDYKAISGPSLPTRIIY